MGQAFKTGKNLEKNVTVLVVEDDEVDIMGIRRAFKDSNLINPIVVAPDGHEALAMLRDGTTIAKPYIVLLDLNMPRMSGLEFLEEARRDPKLKESVVFILTTSNAPDDKKTAYAHNIAGYIVKNGTTGGFIDAASLLNHYARVCELPHDIRH